MAKRRPHTVRGMAAAAAAPSASPDGTRTHLRLLAAVVAADARLRGIVRETPLEAAHALAAAVGGGARVLLKLESEQVRAVAAASCPGRRLLPHLRRAMGAHR